MTYNFPFKQFFSITFFTLVSKVLGFVREWSRAIFFGVGDQADIFLMAYRIPFFFYKICSEGPLSAAIVPFVATKKDGHPNSCMMKVISCSMVMVQSFFIALSLIIMATSSNITSILAPGWQDYALAQVVSLIPILMSSMVFMSASFYLSSVLQGSSLFSTILMQPILLNVLLIMQYGICWYANLSLKALAVCYFIDSIFIFWVTFIIFRKYHRFVWSFDRDTLRQSWALIQKIVLTCITTGVMEINTLIDMQFASFYGAGTLALMSYSGIVLRIPLSIFGACLSMALLPKFSLVKDDKKALLRYIKDSAFMLTIFLMPVIVVMYSYAPYIFSIGMRFSETHSIQAAEFLRASLLGLFFFCLNRILLNVYYALVKFKASTYISFASVVSNVVLNVVLSRIYGAPGLMLATSCASIIQSCLLWLLL